MKRCVFPVLVLILLFASGSWAGQFKPFYPKVSASHQEFHQALQEAQVLESISADLNSVLSIPTDVWILFGECGEPNAFYDPDRHSITICYELIDVFYDKFEQEGLEGDDLDDSAMNATVFTFYHELGHALVHILDLPITGKEEDAVDQLSTFILADGSDEGEAMALDGALSFYSEEEEGGEPAYWDEHSLNQQRFFNIICWVYGENPEKYEGLVQQGYLPEQRAARCPSEWEQIDKSWSILLQSNIK